MALAILTIKYGMVRKPTIVKAYIYVIVSLSVKAVHLEAVTDLTSEAALRRFIARWGYPTLIWGDNGTILVGASREIKEFHEFLKQQQTNSIISEFCSTSNIEWRFVPEQGFNLGGLLYTVKKNNCYFVCYFFAARITTIIFVIINTNFMLLNLQRFIFYFNEEIVVIIT